MGWDGVLSSASLSSLIAGRAADTIRQNARGEGVANLLLPLFVLSSPLSSPLPFLFFSILK